jgi:DNA (cytosine-5)-methyltransferase 1
MAEVAALPWNGRNVISTFSGCGGSSLGYKMAGFKVLWASEFIPAAQEVYRLNHPGTVLDTRDIRKVQPADIMAAAGLAEGALDLLDGSPPCASFSTAGKRDKAWGQVRKYSDTQQRTDDLFFEFARILRGLRPKAFVAENVSGLVSGRAKGYFLMILRELQGCGYRVEARLLDAQWLGVPQSRRRLIFFGVRNDLGLAPTFPKPLPYRYTVRDAIPWAVRHSRKPSETYTPEFVDSATHPAQAIMASEGTGSTCYVEAETDISGYAIGREWDKLRPGEHHPKYLQLVKADPDQPCPTICAAHGSKSVAGVVHPTERRKFSIAELRRICGFPDDFVLTGTFKQQWERLGRAVPPVMMSHVARAVDEGVLSRCAV